ncbi:unnamed protein product, partial [Ectocarpus sp. 6 AP-2014]
MNAVRRYGGADRGPEMGALKAISPPPLPLPDHSALFRPLTFLLVALKAAVERRPQVFPRRRTLIFFFCSSTRLRHTTRSGALTALLLLAAACPRAAHHPDSSLGRTARAEKLPCVRIGAKKDGGVLSSRVYLRPYPHPPPL